MVRGAKKKGKGDSGPVEAESNDIINIFKDKSDPVSILLNLIWNLKGNKRYKWVSNLVDRTYEP